MGQKRAKLYLAIWRRIFIACMFVIACVSESACGVTATAAREGGHESTTTPRERLGEFAQVVNLRVGDIRGIRVDGQGGVSRGLPVGQAVDRCGAKVGRSAVTYGALSATFVRAPVKERRLSRRVAVVRAPVENIYSAVYVMRTEKLARRVAEAVGDLRTRTCLDARRHANHGMLAGEMYKKDVAFRARSFYLSGVHVAGLRESGTLAAVLGSTGRTRPSFYSDLLCFYAGRAVVVLKMRSVPQPIDLAKEQMILSLLVRRADARKIT
jgi:hypothetical protein